MKTACLTNLPDDLLIHIGSFLNHPTATSYFSGCLRLHDIWNSGKARYKSQPVKRMTLVQSEGTLTYGSLPEIQPKPLAFLFGESSITEEIRVEGQPGDDGRSGYFIRLSRGEPLTPVYEDNVPVQLLRSQPDILRFASFHVENTTSLHLLMRILHNNGVRPNHVQLWDVPPVGISMRKGFDYPSRTGKIVAQSENWQEPEGDELRPLTQIDRWNRLTGAKSCPVMIFTPNHEILKETFFNQQMGGKTRATCLSQVSVNCDPFFNIVSIWQALAPLFGLSITVTATERFRMHNQPIGESTERVIHETARLREWLDGASIQPLRIFVSSPLASLTKATTPMAARWPQEYLAATIMRHWYLNKNECATSGQKVRPKIQTVDQWNEVKGTHDLTVIYNGNKYNGPKRLNQALEESFTVPEMTISLQTGWRTRKGYQIFRGWKKEWFEVSPKHLVGLIITRPDGNQCRLFSSKPFFLPDEHKAPVDFEDELLWKELCNNDYEAAPILHAMTHNKTTKK